MKIIIACGLVLIFFFGIGATLLTKVNYDEISKLKQLLDNGIITQEEFDTKKKQLLGL